MRATPPHPQRVFMQQRPSTAWRNREESLTTESGTVTHHPRAERSRALPLAHDRDIIRTERKHDDSLVALGRLRVDCGRR